MLCFINVYTIHIYLEFISHLLLKKTARKYTYRFTTLKYVGEVASFSDPCVRCTEMESNHTRL
jgi:hypothetical protein